MPAKSDTGRDYESVPQESPVRYFASQVEEFRFSPPRFEKSKRLLGALFFHEEAVTKATEPVVPCPRRGTFGSTLRKGGGRLAICLIHTKGRVVSYACI